VFENRVLRRIFGSNRVEITGEWRRLHNEWLNDLYCSSNILRVSESRRKSWAGHVVRVGEWGCVYWVLATRLERKRPLGKPRLRWEDNIKMDLQEVMGNMDWFDVA